MIESRLFQTKLASIIERGFSITGYILTKGDNEVALFDGSCRWLDGQKYMRLMHEQDGSLFHAPTAAEATDAQVAQELVRAQLTELRGILMVAADGNCPNCNGSGVFADALCKCVKP